MGRIDRETVQRILETADIVEVVSDFVKLRRSGANYKGLCPFHNERTPSFSVNKARNICKCFSCGKGGSPVNFIMEHEQMSYNEALRYLARKYNIEIVERELNDAEKQAQSERESLLAVNQYALNHFRRNLNERPEGQNIALPYFRHRGLSDQMIDRFQLGYAIDRGDELLKSATGAGFNADLLVKTGLEVETQRDGARVLYDRFRGRVIFPIFSVSGRVVGFGGRTMRTDKNIAKYVNSPDSPVYHKNLEIYGFYQAKSAIGRRDKCIMVEGYLDVISMHQAGIENVVASSGTSLTVGQIRAVRRFTENVTLIYDADAAGIKASLRGINMLLAEKMNVKVLLLPEGHDPDSFAQSRPHEEVEEYLRENEVDIIAFMCTILLRDVAPNDPMGRAKAINVILQSLAWVDEPIKRQEYLTQCSQQLGVPEDVLNRQLNVFTAKRYEEQAKEDEREKARRSIADIVDNDTAKEASTVQQPAAAETAPQGTDVRDDESAFANAIANTDAARVEPYEKQLARYLVRYGLSFISDILNDDGSLRAATVYDIIFSELQYDDYRFSHPGYAAVFNAVGILRNGPWPADREAFEKQLSIKTESLRQQSIAAIREKGASVAQIEAAEKQAMLDIEQNAAMELGEFDVKYVQQHLLNSPDDIVRTVAADLVADRYVLSSIYSRQPNILSEQQQLDYLVPRAVNGLRAVIVENLLKQRNRELAQLDPAATDRMMEKLKEIRMLKEYQKKLLKVLGERIILPRQN